MPSTAERPGGCQSDRGVGLVLDDDNLDKVLAHAFVGLIDDMGNTVRLSGLCSNRTHTQLPDFLQPSRRPYPHLLLSPLDPASELRFVGTLAAELKKMSAA